MIRMSGFIDIHTHILPGIDDGAKDMPEALEMVRMAWENGTRGLFLTPHYRGKYKKNSPAWLRESFAMFKQMVQEQYPEMQLYLGHEIGYEQDVQELLEAGSVLRMNDSQYVMLEFQTRSFPSQILNGIMETVRYGYTPIVAHVERYECCCNSPDLVEEMCNLGALIQINADSVMGEHGYATKRFCHMVLKKHLVHFVASDAHTVQWRQPLLLECWRRLNKKYGGEYAAELFIKNAQAVIENNRI